MKTYTSWAYPVAIFGLAALLSSCQESGNHTHEAADMGSSRPSIVLADVPGSPEFPDAALALKDVKATASGDSVKLRFAFDVKNYELKKQTADADGKGCNNSPQGQHIHFILNNAPYIALYEPAYEITVAKNTEHILMAFLSRSYHESLKNKEAALVYHFRVRDNGTIEKLDIPSTPMVFYSRPKGDYTGEDIKNLLFDFYVWNTSLQSDYQVKAKISGGDVDTTLEMKEWKSYFLQNMPEGKINITLTLTDAAGNKVDGPETEVSRDFTLAKDEPLP